MTARTARSFVALCVLSLVVCSCRHAAPEPEKVSTEAQIRQHIVGEWTVAGGSDGYWYPKLIIAQDGTLTGVYTNGTMWPEGGGRRTRVLTNEVRVLVGTWEMYRHLLRVTPTRERLQAARASGFIMNDWDYFPVVYADDQELVMTPGISMAGRWRYKK